MTHVNLIKLQHFFEVDNRIKKEMYNNAPPGENVFLDEESLCKYTNDLEDALIYIFSELKCIALDIFGANSLLLSQIEKLEISVRNNFYACGINIIKLRNFYKTYISNMELAFVNEVKDNCVGYKTYKNLPVNMANSINEILHLMHSYVLNNESILQFIPVVAQKINDFDYPIILRGNATQLFFQLFEQFPHNLDVGVTDMVGINERKILMMVRDRGHALTMEITLNGNIARIEYFIPKLCNIDMINALPGVNKVNSNSVGATGVIETDLTLLPETIYNFISKVPTDDDIVFENKIR